VWALSVKHSHLHHWLCCLGNTRVTTAQFQCRSVISSYHSVGLNYPINFFIIHISHCFRPLSFISRSKSSLYTPNFLTTVKPVKLGQSWDKPKVSLIERCPHFTGQLALRTAVWDQMRCPYFTGCPHFAGLLFTGFTVFKNFSHLEGWKKAECLEETTGTWCAPYLCKRMS
jgi:hypothetical protein